MISAGCGKIIRETMLRFESSRLKMLYSAAVPGYIKNDDRFLSGMERMILYRKKFAGPLLVGAAVGTALALAPAAHAEPPYAEIRRVLDPDRKLLGLQSRPLTVPHEVDSWLVAKVL